MSATQWQVKTNSYNSAGEPETKTHTENMTMPQACNYGSKVFDNNPLAAQLHISTPPDKPQVTVREKSGKIIIQLTEI